MVCEAEKVPKGFYRKGGPYTREEGGEEYAGGFQVFTQPTWRAQITEANFSEWATLQYNVEPVGDS